MGCDLLAVDVDLVIRIDMDDIHLPPPYVGQTTAGMVPFEQQDGRMQPNEVLRRRGERTGCKEARMSAYLRRTSVKHAE